MKFSHFFIDRPIFATVISVFITFVGLIAFSQLSLTQYPNIAPPTVNVSGSYSGASPEVIMNTTLAPLEQKLNGVEGMIYMSSEATSEGSWSINITFETGVNIDMAQVLVQNRVRQAENRIPQEVRDVGINVYKRNPDILMTINLVSPNGTRDKIYLSNYAITQMQDRLARVKGVSEFGVWGAKEYSMRVWLDPDRLAAVNLSPIEVVNALKEQNKQVAAGRLNQPPSDTGAAFELLINAQGRLATTEEFGDIIVKYTPDGRIIHLKDIARIELGAYSYSNESYINQKSSVTMGVYQLPGTNAIETVKRLRAELEEIKKSFPDDVDYIIGYDTTEYVQESINALYRTIFEAVVLVVLVIIVFLQSWRAAIIPLFAIPVSLIGTFAIMYASGFTINNLTLFGLVLAIGIVVDDAIVVVENVERNMKSGLGAREATKQAMSQIQGALIAIVLVLSSAFLPTAFLPGISGQFYRQFAITISTSTIISGLVSLTLTPALCALFMRHSAHEKRSLFDLVWDYSLGFVLKYFNLGFDKFASIYGKFVKFAVRISAIMLILYCGMIWATKEIFVETPTGFIPKQDRGSFNAWLRLPDGASFERSEEAVIKAGKLLADIEGIRYAVTTAGQGGSNVGRINFRLSDRKVRDENGWTLDRIMNKVKSVLDREILEATVNVTTPATVPGIGSGSDFKMQVEDRAGFGVSSSKIHQRTRGGNQRPPRRQRRLHNLHDQQSPALRRYRPREGAEAQCLDRLDFPNPAIQPRLRLCERLQHSGPRLPRRRAGGGEQPQGYCRHLQAKSPERPRAKRAARVGSHHKPRHRPVQDSPLQPLSERRNTGQPERGIQYRIRHGGSRKARGESTPAGNGYRVDRPRIPAKEGGELVHIHLCGLRNFRIPASLRAL